MFAFTAADLRSRFGAGSDLGKDAVQALGAAAYYDVFIRLLTERLGLERFMGEDAPALAAGEAGIIGRIRDLLDEHDPSVVAPEDLLKQIHQDLFAKSVRHDLGEYYTPEWLAGYVLDQAGYDGDPDRRVLDPSCGSGAFLVAIISRARTWFRMHRDTCGYGEDVLLRKILINIIGLDKNPLAVQAARANFLLSIRDLMTACGADRGPQVLCGDTLSMTAAHIGGPVDLVAGNPPWINWEDLPEADRQATRPLWDRYQLRPERGQMGRMRGGKKDLSMLFVYACAEHYLRDEGLLAFVITQTLFKTVGAGDGFRRLCYTAREDPRRVVFLSPQLTVDMSALQPFAATTNRTAVFICRKSAQPVTYPTPYLRWSRRPGGVAVEELVAVPIAAGDPASPWLTVPLAALSSVRRVLGKSAYVAHEGVNTGGLNGVYWVREVGQGPGDQVLIANLHEVGKKKVAAVEAAIEPDLLYPLLRGRDVWRWHARPSCLIVAPQDPDRQRRGLPVARMQEAYPLTLAYLRHFEQALLSRADRRYYPKGAPFYTMRNMAGYSLATWKVLWPEVGRTVRAAVVGPQTWCQGGRVAVPDHTLVAVSCSSEWEAHFICGLLNSSPAQCAIGGYLALHPSPHVLRHIAVPGYRAEDPVHRRIAEVSLHCHQTEGTKGDGAAEAELDQLAAALWGLSAHQLSALRAAPAQAR